MMMWWSLITLLAILWNHANYQVSSQNVAPPLSGSEKADIVFALHLSDKANDREVRTVLNYLNSLISGSDVDNGRVKIGLLTYNEDAEVIFNINQYNSVPLIMNEVLRTESRTRSSNVDASAALAVGTQMLNFRYSERSDAPKALIFVTDSASTENEELIQLGRLIVESEQVNVFSIGIGLSGKEELESLATAPENVLTVSRYSELPSTIDDLRRKIFAFRTRDEKAVPEPEKPESTRPEPHLFVNSMNAEHSQAIAAVEPDEEAGPVKGILRVVTPKPGTVVRNPQTCVLAKTDLVIILDASTSVTEPNYKKMLAFCKDILKDADIDSGCVRVGVVIYSTDVQIQFHLNRYSTKSALFAAIDKIRYIYGSTNTADGLKIMRTKMFTPANGDRPDVNNVAMIMTDGISNINARRTIPEAEQARAAGIHIYAVGIGLSDTKELNAMASPPASENSFSVKEFDDLAGLAENIFSSVFPGTTCLAPLPTETTTKLTTTTIPLTMPTTTTKLTPTADPACGLAKVDLVIVLDASTSVTEPNYKKMLSFCKDFLKDADIDSGSVRVGIVIYSTDVQIQFHLNEHSTKDAVFKAIDKIPYISGATNTADALQTMRMKMYTEDNGDRSDVRNIAMVMTDGISNINARRTIPEAELARTAGIHIYAIGIGLSGTKELDAIATPPARENSFAVLDFNELAGLAFQMYSSICPGSTRLPLVPTETTTTFTTIIPLTMPTTTTKLTPTADPACGLAKVDLVIVLDASTSVTEPNYKKMLSFCKDFLKDADIDSGSVRVGIVIYSTDVQIQFHLNEHSTKDAVFKAIDKIPYINGSTNTADALQTMRMKMYTEDNGDRSDVRNVALVMTDGISNINARRTIPEAELARTAGIHIYAIGIGLSDTKELDAIATPPARENSFAVLDFNELAGLAFQMYSSICPGSTRLPLVPTETTTTFTTIIPLTMPTTTTKLTPTADPACGLAKVDLVIVLDASTSVTEPNYKKMLSFCKDFLKDADIDSGSVRVGIVIYSTDVQIQFHLNEHSTKDAVFKAIDKIPYIYGSTNTAYALQTMRMKMYTVDNGDRSDVRNVALVMTDGISNINARRTIPEAELARTLGIHIYAIGIGLSDTKELDAIATPPARENSFAVLDFNELAGLAFQMYSSICPGSTRLPLVPTETTTTFTTIIPLTMPTTTTKLTPTAEPACGLAKVDLVIVLDASTSVTEPNYKKMLSFCKGFLKDADIDSGSVRVGIVIYSTDVQIQFHLNEHSTKDAVFKAIDKIPYIYGSTNTADALQTMRMKMYTEDNGDRSDVRNVALVMTDGISNINARRTIPEAELARSLGIHIYAIGIGLSDTKELDAIATPPARENSFAVLDFNELAGLAVRMYSSICPVVPTTPEPHACSLSKVDLVFILDASTSVTKANYKKMLAFCKNVLGYTDIDSGNVRVGVVIYSTDVDIQFHLNQYSKITDVFTAIDNIPYIYGSTNTADGLRTMRTEMFTVANGDRPDADNVAVIITDGISNINARRTVPEAVQARAMGIHIYAIGIGLSDSTELDAIASEPAKDNSFSIQVFDELVGLENTILSSICLEFGKTERGAAPPTSMPPTTTTSMPPTTTSITNTEAITPLTDESDHGIECYHCEGISNPSNCRDTTFCSSFESCQISMYENNQQVLYSQSCQSKLVCDTLSYVPSIIDIIGRKPATALMTTCCNTALCNNAISAHGNHVTGGAPVGPYQQLTKNQN